MNREFIIDVKYISIRLSWLLAMVSLIYIFPTTLNLIISYFATKRISKKSVRIIAFIGVSLLLYLNIRAPFIIKDCLKSITFNNQTIEKKIDIDNNIFFYLDSNKKNIKLKKYYFNTYGVGGDAGCMCSYTINPRMVTFNIEEYLLKRGLNLTNDPNSKYHININQKFTKYTTIINIEVLFENKLTAQFTKYYRIGFPFEYGETIWSDRETETVYLRKKILSYLYRNNFLWDLILIKRNTAPYSDKLESFFNKAINDNSGRQITRFNNLDVATTDLNLELTDAQNRRFRQKNIQRNFTRDNKNIYINDSGCKNLTGKMFHDRFRTKYNTEPGVLRPLIIYSCEDKTKALYIKDRDERIKSINCNNGIFVLTETMVKSKPKVIRLYYHTPDFSLINIYEIKNDFLTSHFLYGTSISDTSYRVIIYELKHPNNRITLITTKKIFDIPLE